MIEFLTVAALLFAFISIGIAILCGVAILFSLVFDMVREKFGDEVAFWVSAALFVAFISALLSGLIVLGEGSGAQ